jgi:hypothetical protein
MQPASRQSRLYGYPEMGRTGLGHSLLAWARCVVWCEATGAQMLAPRWLRLRIGPYLRRERDKREYFKLFQRGKVIGWLKRSAVLAIAGKTCSHEGLFSRDVFDTRFVVEKRTSVQPHVVVFDNAGADNELNHFHWVKGHASLLRERFFAMVRPAYLPDTANAHKVAIHVRMGDFLVAKTSEDAKRNNTRIPVSWYQLVLTRLRTDLNSEVAAIVYSDGSDEDLFELLQTPRVERAPHQESVTDLLSISLAPVLIASGSGFSLWGSFFGQVPTIHFPGRKRMGGNTNPLLDIEAAGTEKLPDSFVATVRNRLSGEPASASEL